MTREMLQPDTKITFSGRRNSITPEKGVTPLPRKEAVEATKEFIQYLIETNPAKAAELQPLLELAIPVEQQLKEKAARDAEEQKAMRVLQEKDNEIQRLRGVISGERRIGRRKFLKYAGITLGVGTAVTIIGGGIGERIYQTSTSEAKARDAQNKAQQEQAAKDRALQEKKDLEAHNTLGTKLSIASEKNWAVHYDRKADGVIFRADAKHPEENYVMNTGSEVILPSRTYDKDGKLQNWSTGIWLMDYETVAGDHIPELRVQYASTYGRNTTHLAERHILKSVSDQTIDQRVVAFTDVYTNETRYASFERIEAFPVKYRVNILDRIETKGA